MWKIKPKPAVTVSTEASNPPYISPEQAVYKEMAIMGESSATQEASIDGVWSLTKYTNLNLIFEN